MTDKESERPPVGTPEFKEWLKKQTAHIADGLFDASKNADFDEIGVMSGSAESLDKTDAESFPDELEEYTAEERRKGFKLHNSEKDSGDQGG